MDSQTTLWYRSPATDFDHALPVGNGRIGGMLFGDPEHEVIKLNEDSVWSGGRRERNNPDAYEGLLEIRKLLAEEHIQAAEAVAFEKMQGVTPNARHYLGFDKDDAGRQFVANFRKVAAEMGFRHENVQAYHPLGCYKDWNDALLNKKSAELIAKGEPDTFDYAEFIAAGKAEKQREKEEKNTYHRSV